MEKIGKSEKLDGLDLMIKSIMFNNPGIEKNIVDAFKICDRKYFIKENSYSDVALHVAHGQTISQPSTIARMLRILKLEPGLDVLEVGTNTGYHASLVAWLVYPGNVTTIEIFPDLAKMARKNLQTLKKNLSRKEAKKFANIEIITGDALDKNTEIWKKSYDRIYFTAGVDPDKIKAVKKMGLVLLKENGLLLYPTREAWDWGALEVWQKNKELKLVMKESGYAFVPLIREQELKKIYKK